MGRSFGEGLEELDLTQAWLAREASLSRQTVSRAVNRDELSDLTRAKIEQALRGVGRGRANPAPGQFPYGDSEDKVGLAILGDTLCNATDLEQWSDRREAQGILPLLVRRLIQATVGCSELHVPNERGRPTIRMGRHRSLRTAVAVRPQGQIRLGDERSEGPEGQGAR